MDLKLIAIGTMLAVISILLDQAKAVPWLGGLVGVVALIVALLEAHKLMKKGLSFKMNATGIGYLFLFLGFASFGIGGALQLLGMRNPIGFLPPAGLGAFAAVLGLL